MTAAIRGMLIAGLLVGCGGTQEPTQSAPEAQVEQTEQAAAQPAEESTSTPTQILITDDAGIDGYPPGSSFAMHLIQEALPGYEVVEATDGSEGMEWAVFHVLMDGNVILRIDPDPMGSRVGGVRTTSDKVVFDTGHGVGSQFSRVFVDGNTGECDPGMEVMSGKVVCRAPGAVSTYYVFSGRWDGPDGELPPVSILETWTVEMVIWSLF